MSDVSFMERLLDGVEVEWKPLGEVSRFINGRAYKKPELLDQGKYPVLRVGNFFTNANWYHSDLELEDDKYCDNGDLLYAWSASFGPRIWEGGKVIYHYHIWKVVPNADLILKKFLFYLLEWDTKALQGEHATGSTMMHVTKGAIESRLVPIPCPNNPKKSLEIQAEIVRILDAFAAHTAELTAELNLRKKQYNYYRDQLLSFEEGDVEWKTLGEFADNLDSKRKPITSGLREAGNIPYYGASGIVDYVKGYIFDGDFLLVSEDGANLLARNTPIAFSISGKTWVNNHAHVLKFDTYAERRYVEYYLNSIDLTPYISGAAQPKLNKKNLESIRIPNPSPTEKERIVTVLDKFDALTSSITEGLPREIELRQKQYEFYRDLLLSFPKPEEVET
ncbi:restriction endonuclease subunit S [Rheinheimera riviphila]|uniref:Restriction endonuclease subunit S n=1 Tax=Rheinheimera riviphila TaxID=1834037 RepID=A0A437QBK0_9GAMM|nr:restriction endonuclease subunit S [Rheinheimera riviphila]RVU31934.1 restriction endonuclease subunit S [Rheinheimera riviphila]